MHIDQVKQEINQKEAKFVTLKRIYFVLLINYINTPQKNEEKIGN